MMRDGLAFEAEQLVRRAERRLLKYRQFLVNLDYDARERDAVMRKITLAHGELRRLQLYSAVVRSTAQPAAFQPEYLRARGLSRRFDD